MTAIDESIHCIAAPSLQRLFQVSGGGFCKPRLSELTGPDPSGSGPEDSDRNHPWGSIWGPLLDPGEWGLQVL